MLKGIKVFSCVLLDLDYEGVQYSTVGARVIDDKAIKERQGLGRATHYDRVNWWITGMKLLPRIND